MLLLYLTGLQHHFQADDGQFISQARIEAANRRCDSYNKMLIVSILIFNAIIIAFITFLFFFPFQKYELWTISLTVYMQFKSFIHRWKCKSKLIKSRANHVLIHVTCFLWVMWSWRWLSRIFDDNKGLTFIFADILKNERWSVNMTDLKNVFLSRFDSWEKLQPLRIRYYPPVKSQTS